MRDELKNIKDELPTGMQATIAFDSTNYINNAVDEVVKTLTETVFIVIVVIFLFLGSLRSVLVPLVAIPVSLIGAVFLMQVFGFTLNLLTLLAVVLSVGLVVDDAIVVVENVERNISEGKTPFEAALISARELVGPIIAMTITLAAVYAPIGFQGGLTGALFREFAFTLAGAVFISGVVALTLSPHDVVAPAHGRPHEQPALPHRDPCVRGPAQPLRPRARAHAAGSRRRLRGLDRDHAGDRSRCTCSHPRSSRRTRTRAWCSAPSTCRRTRRSSS